MTTTVTASKKSRPVEGSAPNRGIVENDPIRYAPEAHAAGSRAIVTSGDLPDVHDSQMQAKGESAQGREVEVLGDTYVSQGGPNRGDLIEMVRDTKTGQLMGVPTRRLRRAQGDRASLMVSGFSRTYKTEEEARAAEASRSSRWEQYAPGRYRLATNTTQE